MTSENFNETLLVGQNCQQLGLCVEP